MTLRRVAPPFGFVRTPPTRLRAHVLDAAAALTILALSACATKPQEPVVITREVKVPVVQPCAVKPIPQPEFVAPTLAALLALPDAAARYQALLGDVNLHLAYEAGLRDVLSACGVK